ncbi:sugar transporter [Penicillium angulare]|uniref:Sugar transporter n=1 Tax=Penicillium angulare TaxID=116970 RepID=A0A9W9KIL0_9EURO|nr:sugar transporter [Penicillium angulare]
MFSFSKRITLWQTFLVTAPAFILYGYNQSGLSSLLKLPNVVQLFPQIDTINTHGAQKSTNSTIEGLVNACLQIGGLLGSLSCSLIGDKLGRRRSIFLAAIICAVGQILQCTAFSLPQFIIGRITLGVGVGQLNVTVPVWQAESSSAGSRGRKVITSGIFICVGFFSSSWINFGFGNLSYGPLQWRISLAIPVIFSLIICLSIFMFPESPRWLVQVNQPTKAKEALARLNEISPDDRNIELEISRIQHSLESTPSSSIKDIFRGKNDSRLGYRFILCMGIQTLQQLVGGNLISVYTTTIFEDNLHLQGKIPQIVAASALTWKFICSFIAFAAVDRYGRRSLFVISGSGMCLCMVVMAVTNSFPESNKPASIISAATIFIFNFFYPIGFLGGNFLYCAEVAPVHLRVAMASMSTANHWLWNFIITMVSPVALSTIGWKYYLVFVSTCACVPIVTLPFYPETMGRNLELIDRVFREAPTIWDIVPMARRVPKGDVAEDNFSGKETESEVAEHRENV